MNTTSTTPSNHAPDSLPKWDLSDFYVSTDDPRIREDIELMRQKAIELGRHKGTIKNQLKNLLEHFLLFQDIMQRLCRVSSYAYLNYATQMTDESAQSFLQSISELEVEVSTHTLFFTHEIVELTDDDIHKVYTLTPELLDYAPWFDRMRLYKDHILELKQEEILNQKELTSGAAWARLYETTLAELTFKDKKNESLNLSQVMERMSDHQAEVRKEAAELLSQELLSKKSLFTLTFNTLLKDKAIQDTLRSYKSPWQARHLSNQIAEEVVDALIQTVKKNYQLCHRYYSWKAREMGVEQIEYWDRNAPPQTTPEPNISWEEAKSIVFDAYHQFSPELAKIGKKFFDNPWIDVGPYPGKTSGAFAHPTTPDVHPYLLLNFVGKRRDVMTLAHELGHGVHQCLSNKQQPYVFLNTPLTVAETASVFGEMLTFQSLIGSAKTKEEKKALLSGKIEDMLNTVFRQIAFHEFEVAMHTRRKQGELTYSDFNTLFIETQREALGKGVNLNQLVENFWMYISHFIRSPFYVYAYAFGDCLVNSLYSVYTRGTVENFQDKYIEMLSFGGKKTYDELLKPFSLDPKDPAFWQGGLNVIKDLIDELEAL